ncbi:MAG TPA: PhoH family protein [Acidimicrobiales bacterium]|nr:PhoH family protein [Acidimicrobiales bacterium]
MVWERSPPPATALEVDDRPPTLALGPFIPRSAVRSVAPDVRFPSSDAATTVVVLDTSVLVADPGALHAFAGCAVKVPLTVVEELDSLKNRPDGVGHTAREALRRVEAMRMAGGGSLADPVELAGGGSLAVLLNGVNHALLDEHYLDPAKADNRIIGTALGLQAEGVRVEVVSNDAALRIKAAHLGLAAKEYVPSAAYGRDDGSPGWLMIDDVPGRLIDELFSERAVAVEGAGQAASLAENEFAVLRAGQQSALARRKGDALHLLRHNIEAFDLRPRNIEQRLALDLLLDPEVCVVALDGPAGTGKTLLAIAAGLEQVWNHPSVRRYERLAIYRPIVAVGRQDLGYLPGTMEEKLDPWMGAIHDAVVALSDGRRKDAADEVLAQVMGEGRLTMESVTYLRGRSLHACFVLLDEAQNLEPSLAKTLLTRAAEGTKVVFTGDTSQIDAPFLSAHNNAMAVVTAALGGGRGGSLFGHIRLTQGERSPLASLAAHVF